MENYLQKLYASKEAMTPRVGKKCYLASRKEQGEIVWIGYSKHESWKKIALIIIGKGSKQKEKLFVDLSRVIVCQEQ